MRMRRTMQFIPGNNPNMVQNAGVLGADSVILDLEDAIAIGEKDAARILTAIALRNVDFYKTEKVVRINSLDSYAQEDIAVIVPAGPDAIMLPKASCAQDIKQTAEWIRQAEKPGQKPVKIIPLLETSLGVLNAYEIATADERVEAIAFGAEDYTAGLEAQRTKEGIEILAARSQLVNAAVAAGVQVIDTPFTDVNDEAGLLKDCLLVRQLGFKGKLTINPRHIDTIHSVFSPSEREINWARRVVDGLKEAEKEGIGVIAIDGKMVDKPIVDRAQRIIELAQVLGLTK